MPPSNLVEIINMFMHIPAFMNINLYVGLLVFCGYVVFDTQMIIGGKHSHSFGIDDAPMAAITLYLDVIRLFLHILRMMGDRK